MIAGNAQSVVACNAQSVVACNAKSVVACNAQSELPFDISPNGVAMFSVYSGYSGLRYSGLRYSGLRCASMNINLSDVR